MMNRVSQVMRTAGRVQLLNAQKTSKGSLTQSVRLSHDVVESDAEFDQRFIDYFNRPNIDGWEVRKAMTELQKHDVIPEPTLIIAALRACRRTNDHSLAVRFLEALRIKCGTKKHVDVVLPWLMQEIKPVLDELGISTVDHLGYDKPEFWIPDANWWWERSWYTEYGYKKRDGYVF
jgi:cytochrome c oxidase subunit 5a